MLAPNEAWWPKLRGAPVDDLWQGSRTPAKNRRLGSQGLFLACSAQGAACGQAVPTDVFSPANDPALVRFLGSTRLLLFSSTAMASLLVLALFSYVITAVFWKMFREYFIQSPLDCIPGPPASSTITGQLIAPHPSISQGRYSTLFRRRSRYLGNISQLYDKSGRFYYDFLRQCESA